MELHEAIGAVRRETILDAPRGAVWALVAEPAGLATWLADDVGPHRVEPGGSGTPPRGGNVPRLAAGRPRAADGDGRRLMAAHADTTDPGPVFAALADPTRREVV